MSNNHNNNFIKNLKSKLSLTLFVIFFSGVCAVAQLKVVPIGVWGEGQQEANFESSRIQAISLPFFDDFAPTGKAQPNIDNWIPGGGVYVNNTMAKYQPSLNFATFDGLSASGKPYEQTNPLLQKAADTLTSQPIDLGGLTAKDSVYLSFYWLAKGLGEMPDISDSLIVEFKNNKNEWKLAWKQLGQVYQDSLFNQVFLGVKDSTFLHANFQFRFTSVGRLSGPYDTWHVDYVYLNKNRSVKTPYLIDMAIRRPLTSILKNYTAMPWKQYQQNPTAAKAGSIFGDVYNNDNSTNYFTYKFIISNTKTKEVYATGSEVKSTEIRARTSVAVEMRLESLKSPIEKTETTLQSEFHIVTSDRDMLGVNLFRNDTIRTTTTLSNYYAYDDGSAEAAVQVNQKNGRAVIRFETNGADTLRGLAINLMRYGADVTGQSFNIQVLKDNNGMPGEMITQRSVSAKYPATRNGVVEFLFSQDSSGIAVPKVFYVGWLQINEPYLAVGYDKNSALGKDQIFFNLGSSWAQQKSLTGSVMIRPVMGNKARNIPLGVEPIAGKETYFFPNPAQNEVHWEKNSFKRIDIYSVQGSKLKTVLPVKDVQSFSVNDLPTGLYLFNATDGKQNFVQKVLISR